LSQSLTSKGVDARGRGRSNYLLAAVAKIVYHFCSDETSASDDHDFHFVIHVFFSFRFLIGIVHNMKCPLEVSGNLSYHFHPPRLPPESSEKSGA
jgi:hypothetical protein